MAGHRWHRASAVTFQRHNQSKAKPAGAKHRIISRVDGVEFGHEDMCALEIDWGVFDLLPYV